MLINKYNKKIYFLKISRIRKIMSVNIQDGIL
jgi:hypothetical protein